MHHAIDQARPAALSSPGLRAPHAGGRTLPIPRIEVAIAVDAGQARYALGRTLETRHLGAVALVPVFYGDRADARHGRAGTAAVGGLLVRGKVEDGRVRAARRCRAGDAAVGGWVGGGGGAGAAAGGGYIAAAAGGGGGHVCLFMCLFVYGGGRCRLVVMVVVMVMVMVMVVGLGRKKGVGGKVLLKGRGRVLWGSLEVCSKGAKEG
jgi:hypothetical protein